MYVANGSSVPEVSTLTNSGSQVNILEILRVNLGSYKYRPFIAAGCSLSLSLPLEHKYVIVGTLNMTFYCSTNEAILVTQGMQLHFIH